MTRYSLESLIALPTGTELWDSDGECYRKRRSGLWCHQATGRYLSSHELWQVMQEEPS